MKKHCEQEREKLLRSALELGLVNLLLLRNLPRIFYLRVKLLVMLHLKKALDRLLLIL